MATELGSLDRWLWVVLDVAGLLALWRKEQHYLLLFLAPVAALALVNAFGKWPFGAFRTNMFMSVYLFPIPILGLELLGSGNQTRKRALLGLVLATSVVPGFLFGFDWHGHKRTWTRDHYERQVIERLYALRQAAARPSSQAHRAPASLLRSAHLVPDLTSYYLKLTTPTFSAKIPSLFRRQFRGRRGEFGASLREKNKVRQAD